jgi:hypothetical protein
MPDYSIEQELNAIGYTAVCGVDEAGRGPLCGSVVAAACILPVSNDLDIPKPFGLRHRAARGISKETDALAIVVSEETGSITAAYNNKFRARMTAEELELILSKGKF